MFLALCCLLPPALGWAAEAEPGIRDIVVTNSSADLVLFLKTDGLFTPEVVSGVQSGLTVKVVFEVRLALVRSAWKDKEIFQGRVNHSLRYDTLKQEYHLLTPERGDGETTLASLDKAKLLLTELNGAKLLPLALLQPDRQYMLAVRAFLVQDTDTSLVRHLLPFGRLGTVKTDWRQVEFRY